MMDTVQKWYYSITEVAKMLNVATSLLRFWEEEFSEIKPNRNNAGRRFYSYKDLRIIKMIYNLLRVELYTIPGAKRQMERFKDFTR